jgi:hypothetical protein
MLHHCSPIHADAIPCEAAVQAGLPVEPRVQHRVGTSLSGPLCCFRTHVSPAAQHNTAQRSLAHGNINHMVAAMLVIVITKRINTKIA